MMNFSPSQFQDAIAANLSFAIKQSAHVESQVYRHKYADLDYAGLIPVDTSAHPWAPTVTYFSIDGTGAAKWMNGNASDVPNADVGMEQFETSVYMAGIGYQYGFEEVNQARMLGISLSSEKAFYARRAYEEFLYNIAFTGNTQKSMEGLFGYTGIPTESIPADGTGSSALWSTKTPDQIIRDVNAMLTGMGTATNHVAMADTLIMPVERLNTIASTRLTDTSLTVLDFIRSNNVYTATTGQALNIRGKRNMLTIGSGSTARMIAYRNSPEVLKMHLPLPLMFLPMQVDGLQFKVPGVFRVGGLDVRLPSEIRYGDGI